ncbi:hypothetical protein PM082_021284 [Marasmius tenuissimus]|nr:hypothetical protein PM082_021284 [Marasmius tenuissimus]
MWAESCVSQYAMNIFIAAMNGRLSAVYSMVVELFLPLELFGCEIRWSMVVGGSTCGSFIEPPTTAKTDHSRDGIPATSLKEIVAETPSRPEREDRVVLNGRTFRRILDGDIIFRQLLSSKVLHVLTEPDEHTPSRSRWNLPQARVVKVTKTVQTAELFGYQGKFTATILEPIGENDPDKFEAIATCVLQAASPRRSMLLPQLFALADSNVLTILTHGELVIGQKLVKRQSRKRNWIVYHYLVYTNWAAVESLRADKTFTMPVARRWSNWSFNLKTLSWQYDITSGSLSPPGEEDDKSLSCNHRTPLRQETLPQLNATEIVACVEEDLGDFLYLIASWGGRRGVDMCHHHARHGALTFGTVVKRSKPGIAAHFSTTPSPEWFCESLNPNLTVCYSKSVPKRVDLSFRKSTSNVRVQSLRFGLRIPEGARVRFRCAYLCQSLQLRADCDELEDVLYLDQVGFSLTGTFPDDLTTRPRPVYLFVPPLQAEHLNNIHRIRYPLPPVLFYWSQDPEGGDCIAPESWSKYGVPKLDVDMWIGSCWRLKQYNVVRDYLRLKKYNLDGKRYALEYGYPKLFHGNQSS